MTKQEYLEKALEYVSKIHPEYNAKTDSEKFSLEINDKFSAFLHTPFNNSKNKGFNDWEKELEMFLQINLETLKTRKELTLEEIKARILPQVKPLKDIEYAKAQLKYLPAEENLFFDDFLADLKIIYVIDSEKTYTYLTLKEINRLKISREEIKKLAIDHLEKLPGNNKVKQVPMEDGNFSLIWEDNDGYDAARILLPNLYKTLSTVLGNEFYIAIPHRDVLVAMGANYKTSLEKFIKKEYEKSNRPVCGKIIKAGPNGLVISGD